MLAQAQAQDTAGQLLEYHRSELVALDEIYAYWTGRQPLPLVPRGVPADVRRLAQMSRINILDVVVSLLAESLYVDGYRDETGEESPAWEVWQANRMDARQSGIHRAMLAYGTSYVIVLPGDPVPVIRGVSPRSLVAMYDEDSGDWADYALEKVQSPWAPTEYRLYDPDAVYTLRERGPASGGELVLVGTETHELGICPVVRYRTTDTLNEPPLPARYQRDVSWQGVTGGEISPLLTLQDQLDVTTLDLLTAQRFQAFKQRWIMGWTADSEEELAKANAASVWTFESPDTKVGEFDQVNLQGLLDSRQSTVTHAGIISQAPPHELLGKVTQMSAEALAAAETSQRRKLQGIRLMAGESHEQTFWLVGRAGGLEISESAQVRWRDTEARSLSQTIDALGKAAQMLEVPVEMLWERLPGFTQQDVDRMRSERAASALLAAATAAPPEAPPPQTSPPTRPELVPVGVGA